MLVAATASAERLTTFAWNAGTDWPPGTTVELCGNGDVCMTGITGTHATLDLPVNPGEVIQGRARAIPPPGYQCGEPLALCQPSGWATVAQTWPAVPIFAWAIRETEMAIPASVLLYTNWDHGTLASGQFSHAAPNIPNTFTWDTASGSIIQDNDTPWNGQYLFDSSVNWYDGLFATLTSATVQATSGRLLVEVDSFGVDNSPILGLYASNRSNGSLNIRRESGNVNVGLAWDGWNGANVVALGAMPSVPFAIEVIYNTQHATANQRLQARMWNIGSTPGSFNNSSTSDGSAANTDQFISLYLADPGNNPTNSIFGRVIISNSTTEDLSAITISSEAGGASLPPHILKPTRNYTHLLVR